MSRIRVWIKASRLQSQSFIFLPVLFGQAWFVSQGNEISWPIFFVMTLFCFFDQLFIVYANDYADYETDCKNTTFTIFSGGSRVLADKDLLPDQLKKSAYLMAACCIGCGLSLTFVFKRPLALPLVIISLGLLWMYSYKPFKLSYKGGGEFLQMTGVGLVLTLFGYYAQSGTFAGYPWFLLWVILPTQLACAMATSLPDEPSDRLFHKKTTTVLLGPQNTKRLIIALNITSILLFPFVSWMSAFNRQTVFILVIPAVSVFTQCFLVNSETGSVKLTFFVTLSVLFTLSIMGGMAASLLC